MKNLNKDVILSFLLIIIAVLIIGGVYVYNNKKSKDQTVNWKTYTNGKYDIKIEYPPSWNINESKGGSISISNSESDSDWSIEEIIISPLIPGDNGNSDDCARTEWNHDQRMYLKNACWIYKTSIIVYMSAKDEQGKAIEDQILSTFKFTK